MATPINSTSSTPVSNNKTSQAQANTGSQGSEKQTDDGVAETQAVGDSVNLSQTSVQLSSEPSEGAIQSSEEASQIASNLKDLISNNPAQAIAAQSGS